MTGTTSSELQEERKGKERGRENGSAKRAGKKPPKGETQEIVRQSACEQT